MFNYQSCRNKQSSHRLKEKQFKGDHFGKINKQKNDSLNS